MTIHRLLPALLLVAACGTATSYLSTATSPGPRPPRSDDSVAVFTDTAPTVPYVEVGLIEGHQRTQWSHAETFDIYASMRHDAAEAGCDAMIVTGSTDRPIRTINGTRRTLEGFSASCVVYMPVPVAAAAPGAAAAPTAALP